MELHKNIPIIIIFIFNLIFISIYISTHYIIINNEIYKNNITTADINLNNTNIKEVNKCTEIEKIRLSYATENSLTKFKNFPNLSDLTISFSEISSEDSEKISSFNNLNYLRFYYSTIDFNNFKNNNLFFIGLMSNKIKNFELLSECHSLKEIFIVDSTISDNYIIKENNNYIMKDSSIFSSFSYAESLYLSIDKIEDISGILNMKSLKEFVVNEDSISEENVKLLEDTGITITYIGKRKFAQ